MSAAQLLAAGGGDVEGACDEAEAKCLQIISREIDKESTVTEDLIDGLKNVLGGPTKKTEECTARLFEIKMRKGIFLSGIGFANDCGYGDVKDLCNSDTPGGVAIGNRSFFGALTIVFAIYNVYFMVHTDWQSLDDPDCTEEDVLKKPFLMAAAIIGALRHLLYAGSDPWPIECRGEGVVGYMELLGLAVIFFRLLVHGVTIWKHWLRDGCAAHVSVKALVKDDAIKDPLLWQANGQLLWDDIPLLSEYSGMKLLGYIQPWILMQDLNFIRYAMRSGKRRAYAVFVVTRLLSVIVGFDVFLTKFRITATYAMAPSLTFTNFMVSFIFMRQVLGIIQVDRLLKRRVFMFIFGGEEGTMDVEENAKMEAWKARIAFEIRKQTIGKTFSILRYAVTMLSFSDSDIQRLILDTRSCSRLGALGRRRRNRLQKHHRGSQ